MKKQYLIFSFLLSLTSLTSKAQFFMGGGVAFNSYVSGVGLFPAIQPKLGFDYKEGRVGITLGFNLSPMVQKNKFNAVYTNPEGTEKRSVLFTETLSMQNVFLRAAYRIGNMENAFRPKVIFGASNDLISIKYKTDQSIPKSLTSSTDISNISTTGPKVEIGVGADYRSSQRDDVNFELVVGLPANQVNGQYIYNPTVAHFGLTIAYSHYFGKREYTGIW